MAARVTPDEAVRNASIVVVPSFAFALAFVTSPTRAPRRLANDSARRTSIPVFASTALAASDAISEMIGFTAPLPSGWTRFERKSTKRSRSGSIHIAVPV